MTLAVDTDVLVHWTMAGAPLHDSARKAIDLELSTQGGAIALVPQVLWEFLHVVTDGRRFENPMTMPDALRMVRELWDAADTLRVEPALHSIHRVLDLMRSLRLGRKRILDTAFAATLEHAGVRRLATFNEADYRIFTFLDLVVPG